MIGKCDFVKFNFLEYDILPGTYNVSQILHTYFIKFSRSLGHFGTTVVLVEFLLLYRFDLLAS